MKLTLDTLHLYCVEDGDCLLWKQSVRGGMPSAHIDGKTRSVRGHVFFTLLGKRLTGSNRISPICGNALCITPAHLVGRTRSETLKAMYKNGQRQKMSPSTYREIRGAAGGLKLNHEKAREIRESGESSAALAEMYGCSPALIVKVRAGIRWAEVANGASVFGWRP